VVSALRTLDGWSDKLREFSALQMSKTDFNLRGSGKPIIKLDEMGGERER